MATSEPPTLDIAGRLVGEEEPPYVIAEMSANHGGDRGTAEAIIREAAAAGADAVKLQTYTPEAMTLQSRRPPFVVKSGTPWAGRVLYDLYREAALPLDWHAALFEIAAEQGITCFSTPFSSDAVDLLEGLGCPAYKIASFELVDLDLIRVAASTGKPLILSTGMATKSEVDEAVRAAVDGGAGGVALLRCNSGYPAPENEMDLVTIRDMRSTWRLPVGLSDHTVTSTAAVVAVALGACIIEKHVTLSRASGGPDADFSLEPSELAELVDEVTRAAGARGRVRYGPSPSERDSLAFRRSLFVVADIPAGDAITTDNVRSIRPSDGIEPKHLSTILGRRAARRLAAGTPLTWDAIE
jgi:N-acetylneuraminate synthase